MNYQNLNEPTDPPSTLSRPLERRHSRYSLLLATEGNTNTKREISLGPSSFASGDGSAVPGVAFSHDNDMFAFISAKGKLKLFDSSSKDLLAEAEVHDECDSVPGIARNWSCLAFHSSGIIVTGSPGGSLKAWRYHGQSSLTCIGEHKAAHMKTIRCVSFSHSDADTLVSCGADAHVRVWKVGDTGSISKGDAAWKLAGQVNEAHISPDGKFYVAAAKGALALMLWPAAGVEELTTELHGLQGHTGIVWSCNFSPNNLFVVSGGADKTVRVWSVHSRTSLMVLNGHSDMVFSACFDDSGRQYPRVLSSSTDGTSRLWETSTGATLRVFQKSESDSKNAWVYRACVGHHGKAVLNGCADGSADLFDASHGSHLMKADAHTSEVSCLKAWCPDVLPETLRGHAAAPFVASGASDNVVRLICLRTGARLVTFTEHAAAISCVAVSSRSLGATVVSGDSTGVLYVFDSAKGTVVCRFESPDHKEAIACAFSPAEPIVASISLTSFCLWDATSGSLLRTIPSEQNTCLAFEPSGRFVAAGRKDNQLHLWSVTETEKPVCVIKGFQGAVTCVDFMHVSDDTSSEAPSETPTETPTEDAVIAVGCTDSIVRTFTWERGAVAATPLHVLRGHTGAVSHLEFSSDNSLLVTTAKGNAEANLVPVSFFWDAGSGARLPQYSSYSGDQESLIKAMSLSVVDNCLLLVHGFNNGSLGVYGPLHREKEMESVLIAITNNESVESIKEVLEMFPSIVYDRNEYGQTLAHVLASMGSSHLPFLKDVLNAKSPSSIILHDDSQLNVLDTAVRNTHYLAVKMILDHLVEELPSLPMMPRDSITRSLPELARKFPEILLQFLENIPLERAPAHVMEAADSTFAFDSQPDMAPSSSFQPVGLWKKPTDAEKPYLATPVHVALPNIGGQWIGYEHLDLTQTSNGVTSHDDHSGSPLHVFERFGHHEILGTETMTTVLDFKWQAFGRRFFLMDCGIYLVYLMLFSILSLTVAFEEGKTLGGLYGSFTGVLRLLFDLVLLAMNSYFLWHEYQQLRAERRWTNYFTSLWNVMDLSSYLLVLVWAVVRLTRSYHEITLLSFIGLMLWLKTLKYARGFQSVGIFVIMIFGILRDMYKFLIILTTVLIAFSFSFFLLQYRLDSDESEYMHFFQTAMTTYRMMLGDFDYSAFDSASSVFMAQLFFFLFTVFVVIVLLNLLIALMGDSFSRVQETAESQWRLEMASLLVEAEQFTIARVRKLPAEQQEKRMNELFPRFVHKVVPHGSHRSDLTTDHAEEERIKMLKKMKAMKKNQKQIWSLLASIAVKLDIDVPGSDVASLALASRTPSYVIFA